MYLYNTYGVEASLSCLSLCKVASTSRVGYLSNLQGSLFAQRFQSKLALPPSYLSVSATMVAWHIPAHEKCGVPHLDTIVRSPSHRITLQAALMKSKEMHEVHTIYNPLGFYSFRSYSNLFITYLSKHYLARCRDDGAAPGPSPGPLSPSQFLELDGYIRRAAQTNDSIRLVWHKPPSGQQ